MKGKESKITGIMKKQFWKHNLNPITGFTKVVSRKASLGPPAVKLPKISINSFSAKHN